jgi:hypothetical protein
VHELYMRLLNQNRCTRELPNADSIYRFRAGWV